MKVNELISMLQTIDPNREVILQKDSEGNGYSPLSGADVEWKAREDSYKNFRLMNKRGN